MFETRDYLDSSIDGLDGVIILSNETNSVPQVAERVTEDAHTRWEIYAKPRSELVEELESGALERTGRKLSEDQLSAIRRLASAHPNAVSEIEEEYGLR